VKQQLSTSHISQMFQISLILFQMLIPFTVADVSQKRTTVSDSGYYY